MTYYRALVEHCRTGTRLLGGRGLFTEQATSSGVLRTMLLVHFTELHSLYLSQELQQQSMHASITEHHPPKNVIATYVLNEAFGHISPVGWYFY